MGPGRELVGILKGLRKSVRRNFGGLIVKERLRSERIIS